mgnify:CR=1 FL=1
MWRAVSKLLRGSLLGKIIGFFRELLFAALYGTTAIAGAYRAAQTAVFIPIQFFASDTLNAGFLPLYTRYKQRDPEQALRLFWFVGGMLTVLSILLAVFLAGLADVWARLLFPGFGESEMAITIRFIQVMALGVPCYFISMMLAYLEMGNGGYTLSSVRASVQSVGLIAGTVAAYALSVPVLLAWGFTLAYLALSLWGLMMALRRKWLVFPNVSRFGSTVRGAAADFWRAIRHLLPLPFFLQGNFAIERAVASLMGVSVVAALDYARLITETAIVLLAVPLGLASLSEMSRADEDTIRRQLGKVIPALLLVTVPLSAFLFFHAETVLDLLYGRGAYDASSLAVTTPILQGLAIGLWAQVIGYVLVKYLNAQMRNREVLFIMVGSLLLNVVLNIGFYRQLGPLVLGLGVSAYGVAVFALGAAVMRLWPALIRPLLAFALAGGLYTVLEGLCQWLGHTGLVLAGFRLLLFWGLAVWWFPVLRQIALDCLVAVGKGRIRRGGKA